MSAFRTYILFLPFIAYLVTLLYSPQGLMFYILPSICWIVVAIVTLLDIGSKMFSSWYIKSITLMALAVAVLQIIIIVDTGFFSGFAINPSDLSLYGLTLNTIYFFSILLGMEFSRAFIMKIYGPKRPWFALAIVSLLFTLMSLSSSVLTDLTAISNPLAITERMGSIFLPALAQNILASYLALIGGPIASMAYMGPIRAYELYLPILPNLPWAFKTMFGVLIPIVGFVYINQSETPQLLRRIGIKLRVPPRIHKRASRSERSSSNFLLALVLIGMVGVWFSTGLLGVFPTVPISGSMSPAMEVGDMAIVAKTPVQELHVGDIIQFSWENVTILHRIIAISQVGGVLQFSTKGDANTQPDPEPISQNQIQGKIVAIIPKIGWTSLYLKEFYLTLFDLISANLFSALALITLIGSGIIGYLFYSRKGRSRHMRRGAF
jgi:signal peptidase